MFAYSLNRFQLPGSDLMFKRFSIKKSNVQKFYQLAMVLIVLFFRGKTQ